MTEVVIDSSYAMSWLFQDEASPETDAAFAALQDGTLSGVVPELFYLEVANTVLQGEKRGRCTSHEGDRFFASIVGLPLRVHALQGADLVQIVSLARTHNLTSYDATYLHISNKHNLLLRTKDRPLLAAKKEAEPPE